VGLVGTSDRGAAAIRCSPAGVWLASPCPSAPLGKPLFSRACCKMSELFG